MARATKIGRREYDAGADDADADFTCSRDGEHKDLAIRATDRAEFVTRDDRGRKTGQCRRVAGKVAQQRGHETACSAPERQAEEKIHPVLGKARRQDHDRYCADYRTDHTEPSFAQRSAEAWLTDNGRGRTGPVRVVKLKLERDIEREADCSPKAQAEEQSGSGGPQRARQ